MSKTANPVEVNLTGEVAPVVYEPPGERPNVLLITMDDVGVDYLTQYNTFQVGYLGYIFGAATWGPVTSGFGVLKINGVVFYNAFAAPVCSPTRAMLLTGRYQERNGIGAVVTGNDGGGCREFSDPAFSSEPTLPQFVREQGYRSILVGKWHLGRTTEAMDPGHDPDYYGTEGWDGPVNLGGFDTFMGPFRNLNQQPRPDTGTPSYGYYSYYWYNSDEDTIPQPVQVTSTNGHITRKQRQELQTWINQNPGEPWLAYWMTSTAHSPYGDATTTPSGCGCPDLAGVPPSLAAYVYTSGYQTQYLWPSVWSAVENLAYEIEVLKSKLGDEVWGRTVVILVGDNGSDTVVLDDYLNGTYTPGGGHPGAFGAGYEAVIGSSPSRLKGSVYSPGTRVPLIISGPDNLVRSKNRFSRALVDIVDIHAFIRRITRSSYYDAVFDSRGIDGVDMYDVIANVTDADEDHRAFSYSGFFTPNGNLADATSQKAVYRKVRSDGIWHLIRQEGLADELYHMQDSTWATALSTPAVDVNELTDLAGSEPTILAEIQANLDAHQAAMANDQWPTE